MRRKAPPASGLPPSAVIFDVGNVLFGWDPETFYRKRVADDAALERFFAETEFFAWHAELDGGRCSVEATADLTGRFPAHAHLISAWSEHFNETITGPVDGVHAIVTELHDRDVPLFAITNFSAEFWTRFHASQAEFFALFRDVIVSGAVKLTKPNPAIYHLALNRFGLTPSEALFVDDRLDNVAAASALGMHAHQFSDAGELRRALEAEGLL